jgi:hypothetical protein
MILAYVLLSIFVIICSGLIASAVILERTPRDELSEMGVSLH